MITKPINKSGEPVGDRNPQEGPSSARENEGRAEAPAGNRKNVHWGPEPGGGDGTDVYDHVQKPIPIRGDEHLDPDQESRHESNGEAPDCRGTCKHPGRPKSMNPTRSRMPPISILAQPRTTAEDRLFIDPGTRQRGPQAEIVTRQAAASTGNRMASR